MYKANTKLCRQDSSEWKMMCGKYIRKKEMTEKRRGEEKEERERGGPLVFLLKKKEREKISDNYIYTLQF